MPYPLRCRAMPATPYTAEHEALRHSVRRLVERELVDAAARAEAGGGVHAEVLARCGALGMLGTGDVVAEVAAIAELARLPSAGLVIAVVDAMLGHDLVGDVALTAVGELPAADVGDGVVTAHLPAAVVGSVAERCVLLDVDVVVPRGAGWSAVVLEQPLALRGGALADVTLEAAPCTPLAVSAAQRAAHDLRVAAAAVGAAWRTWEGARTYALQREAFGRPIGRFQVNRHALARGATRLTAAESLVEDATWHLATGAGADGATARRYAVDAAVWVSDVALQLHGGYGYTTEFDVERAWRDAHALAVRRGDSRRAADRPHGAPL